MPVKELLVGTPYPTIPDPNPESGWRRGFRCTVKLPDKLANGTASVREWASATLATTRAFDALHDQWLAAYKAHAGMVAVCSCTEVKEVAGARGTNYLPVLEITRWVETPADLRQPVAPGRPDTPPFDPGEPEARGDDEPEDFDFE